MRGVMTPEILGLLPLVLDPLDLVIHAEHDVAQAFVVNFIVLTIFLGIIEIRVDGILIIDFVVVVSAIKASNAFALGVLGLRGAMLGGLLERQHQATAFHGLGPGRNLLMEHAVDFDPAKLVEIARRTLLHKNTFEASIVTGAVRLPVADMASGVCSTRDLLLAALAWLARALTSLV